MKNLRLLIFFSLVLLLSCKEEQHTPLFSGEAPNPVSDYSVENISGGAIISYKLDDPRTSYVKAIYTVEHGLTRESRASKYGNKLVVDGFAESKEYAVALYSIGQGEEESEPIHITVHPTTPPHQLAIETMEISADWGGGRLSGENPVGTQFLIVVVKRNQDTGEWEDVEVFVTESKFFEFNFRNQDPVETEYGVYVRDRWQNYSDTLRVTFTPWEEIHIPIDPNNANHFPFFDGDAPADSRYPLKNAFDGRKGPNLNLGYHAQASAIWPKTVTIDLLHHYELSRWILHQNSFVPYRGANPKHIRIWGRGDAHTEWILLGEWDDWRPSGRPSTDATMTDEDLEAVQAGNNFDFLPNLPGVRLIRMELFNTWEPRQQVSLVELEFHGRRSD